MVFSLFLKASKIFRSILEMLGNLRVIRKSLMKNWESSEVFSLVNSWAVWPLTTSFGVPGVFLAVSRVFQGIMGCSGGVPGLFRAVPGCSGGVPGMFQGVPGVFRGVPACSGFYSHPVYLAGLNTPEHTRNIPEHPRNTLGTPRNTPGTPRNTPEYPQYSQEHPWTPKIVVSGQTAHL